MRIGTPFADTRPARIAACASARVLAKPFATKDMGDLKDYGHKLNINDIEAWDIAYLSEKIKSKITYYSK